MSKGVCKELSSGAAFPAADLVYVDVIKGGSGMTVIYSGLFGWHLGVFVYGVFGCGGVSVDLGASFLGSKKAVSQGGGAGGGGLVGVWVVG